MKTARRLECVTLSSTVLSALFSDPVSAVTYARRSARAADIPLGRRERNTNPFLEDSFISKNFARLQERCSSDEGCVAQCCCLAMRLA
jgi:hypothetical protein